MKAKCFEDLVVWQKMHALVLAIYTITRSFPEDERFGLTAQIRRSATSVAANIAEGFGKESDRDKCRYYNIAQSSLDETRYFLILTMDLGFSDTRELLSSANEIGRMLRAYRNTILDKDRSSSKY